MEELRCQSRDPSCSIDRSLLSTILVMSLGEFSPLALLLFAYPAFFRKRRLYSSSRDGGSLEIKVKSVEIARPGEVFHARIRP